MAEPRGAGGEGGAEADRVVRAGAEPGQPQGDVDVGGREDPGAVELEQRARRAEREGGVEGVERARGSSRAAAVEVVAQRLDQLCAADARTTRRRARHRQRRLGRAHAADEEIEHPAQVPVGS